MDLTTIIGMLAAFGLIVMGIGVDKLGNFFDLPSIAIVVGGTLAALVASFPISTLKTIPSHFKIIIGKQKQDPMMWIDKLTEYAQLARKNGLLVLEEKAREETDTFFRDGILLIVDAVDADKTKARLDGDLEYINERHEEAVGFYEKGAALAPAMGMIGTLIGLINMLKGMNLDGGGSSTIGQDMSVALITTFYGSALANIIFMPIVGKLRVRNAEELLCKQIIIEGILAIQAGENPKYIREKLLSFLPQSKRSDGGEGGEGGEGGGKPKKAKKEKKPKA